HAESANAIAVRPDGTEAVVGIESRLLVYALPGGALARELPRLPGVVRSVAWSPDGDVILATVFYDAAAHVIDAADGHERRRLPASPDGRLVATVDLDRAVRVRDVDSGAVVETLGWHRAPTIALAWAGNTLVSADFEGHVALWDVAAPD